MYRYRRARNYIYTWWRDLRLVHQGLEAGGCSPVALSPAYTLLTYTLYTVPTQLHHCSVYFVTQDDWKRIFCRIYNWYVPSPACVILMLQEFQISEHVIKISSPNSWPNDADWCNSLNVRKITFISNNFREEGLESAIRSLRDRTFWHPKVCSPLEHCACWSDVAWREDAYKKQLSREQKLYSGTPRRGVCVNRKVRW